MHKVLKKIAFDDVDAACMVYYPRFFHLCHLALEDFFNELGPVSYAELIKDRNIGFPTVHTEATFLHPLLYGDVVEIQLSVSSIGRSSVEFHYSFVKDKATNCFRAVTKCVCMNIKERCSVTLPDDIKGFLASHMARD